MERKLSDKEAKSRPFGYLAFLPRLVRVARWHGYALCLHGSLVNDFDLVAIPWVADAADPHEFAEDIRQECGGLFGGRRHVDDPNFVTRDHGRIVYTIVMAFENFYIDLSVMPRTT